MGSTNAEDETLVRFWNERLSPFLRHVVTSLGSLTLSLTLLWSISKPHAELFIRDVVAQERFASQTALESIDERIRRVEKTIRDVLQRQADQAIIQSRMDADMALLKELQKEQREDVKSILQAVR